MVTVGPGAMFACMMLRWKAASSWRARRASLMWSVAGSVGNG